MYFGVVVTRKKLQYWFEFLCSDSGLSHVSRTPSPIFRNLVWLEALSDSFKGQFTTDMYFVLASISCHHCVAEIRKNECRNNITNSSAPPLECILEESVCVVFILESKYLCIWKYRVINPNYNFCPSISNLKLFYSAICNVFLIYSFNL